MTTWPSHKGILDQRASQQPMQLKGFVSERWWLCQVEIKRSVTCLSSSFTYFVHLYDSHHPGKWRESSCFPATELQWDRAVFVGGCALLSLLTALKLRLKPSPGIELHGVVMQTTLCKNCDWSAGSNSSTDAFQPFSDCVEQALNKNLPKTFKGWQRKSLNLYICTTVFTGS